MTTRFVSNAATFVTGLTEGDAYQTLGAAITAATAADIIKISSTHTETAGAAIAYTFPTTPGLILRSVLFNGAGTGAYTRGASINVGATSASLTLGGGFVDGRGIDFTSGTTNNVSSDFNLATAAAIAMGHVWDDCTFNKPSTTAGSVTTIGHAGAVGNDDVRLRLTNCTLSKGDASSFALRGGIFEFEGLVLAGTAPTNVFALTNGAPCNCTITGSDLSGVAWTALVAVTLATYGFVLANQCKLPTGAVAVTGTFPGPGQAQVVLVDCSDGDNHYTYQKHCWEGSVVVSNTKYADASDGTTPVSLLMTSSANASLTWPLVSPDITISTKKAAPFLGVAITTTVHVAHNGVGGGTGGKLLNSECYQITMAKITSGVTRGTWNRADRVADILAAGADQDTDATTTWTGASIATHDNLISGSMTPAEIGPITTVVKLAKPSVAVHVSPKVAIA